MLSFSDNRRIFLARQAVDMRKGCVSLAALVENALGHDPYAGDIFVFVGRRKNRVKLIAWDRSGFQVPGASGAKRICQEVPSTYPATWRVVVPSVKVASRSTPPAWVGSGSYEPGAWVAVTVSWTLVYCGMAPLGLTDTAVIYGVSGIGGTGRSSERATGC